MKALRAGWQRYVAWFAARQPREKVVVAVATVGGILFVGYSYAVEPALLASRRAVRMTTEAKAAATQAVAAAVAIQRQNLDPDVALRAELERHGWREGEDFVVAA